MVFPWFPMFSHGFPMVFPANLHPSRQDGAVKVYDRFLEARARNQGLNFRMDGTAAQGGMAGLGSNVAGWEILELYGGLEKIESINMMINGFPLLCLISGG